MIRFACPRCKAVLEDTPGAKVACPGCGATLRVPMPAQAEPAPAAAVAHVPASAPPPTEVEVRLILDREHLFWDCPLCRSPVDTPLDVRQQSVRCPHCAQKIPVPRPEGLVPRPVTPALPVEPVLVPEVVDDARSSRKDRPRRRRGDDEDAYSRRIRRSSKYDLETCQRAATSGLTCSLIGLGLLLIVFFLWVVAAGANTRPATREPLIFLMLLADLGSFLLSLCGVIFSSRGMSPINDVNRGPAVAGLVCGIIGLVISSIVGLVLSCIGVVMMTSGSKW